MDDTFQKPVGRYYDDRFGIDMRKRPTRLDLAPAIPETLVDIDTDAYRLRLDVKPTLTFAQRRKALDVAIRYLTELQRDMAADAVSPNVFERAACEPETGIAIRYIKQWDITKDQHPTQADVDMVHQSFYLALTRRAERLGIPQSVLDAAITALRALRLCGPYEAMERFACGLNRLEARDQQTSDDTWIRRCRDSTGHRRSV